MAVRAVVGGVGSGGWRCSAVAARGCFLFPIASRVHVTPYSKLILEPAGELASLASTEESTWY